MHFTKIQLNWKNLLEKFNNNKASDSIIILKSLYISA